MNGRGITTAPAGSSPAPHGQVYSHSSSAVRVVLILLYLLWRFIWQCKKHPTTGASPSSSSALRPSSCPSRAAAVWLREWEAARRACETTPSSSPLPVFVRVDVAAATVGCGVGEKADCCAVWLAGLGDGKAAARLVPGCGHGFHAECIETWLRVNSTCPLCRAAVPAAEQSAVPAPGCNV